MVTLTLCISSAGAGMLSTPYAFQNMGIVCAIIATIILALLNAYTMHILARFTIMYSSVLPNNNYDSLITAVCGKKCGMWSLFSIFVGGLGALSGFLLILSSLAHQALWQWCGGPNSPHSDNCGMWSSRAACALIVSGGVLFPLTFVRSMHKLTLTTWLSWMSVLGVMGCVLIRAAQTIADSDYSQQQAGIDMKKWETYLFNPSPDLLLGFPIVVFTLGNQLQIPIVVLELFPPLRPKVSTRVVPATSILVASLYLVTGIFGVATFGSNITGDILLDYSTSDALATVAKLLMALHITFAFPVQLAPSRESMEMLCGFDQEEEEARSQAKTSQLEASVSPAYRDEPVSPPRSFRCSLLPALPPAVRRIIMIIFMLSICVMTAILIPEVQIIFGLLGATVSVSQVYLFPALLLIYHSFKEEQWELEVTARNSLAAPASVSELHSHSQHLLSASSPLLPPCNGSVTTPDSASRLAPSSAASSSWRKDRRNGYLLIAWSVIMCVVGTSATIWDTFF